MDLCVFAPVGVAISAVEEFPHMAEVGRQSVDVRVASARAVGQFVCLAGGQELKRRAEGLWNRSHPRDASDDSTPEPSPSSSSGPEVQVGRTSSVDVATLAIPGYDTLSASQVVQRLDGLDQDSLAAVERYESETRGRRTILARIVQLRSGDSTES